MWVFYNVHFVVSDPPADGSLSAQLLPQWLKADEFRWVSWILTSPSSWQVIGDNVLIVCQLLSCSLF